MRLSQLPAEWRERILEQRRKDHAAARFFVEACKIGSVELFCDAVDRMRDDAIGGDAWRVAFKGIATLPSVSPEIQQAFLFRVWITSKMLPLRVDNRRVLANALRLLLPGYAGPPIRVYRGAGAHERRRRVYGFSWTTDIEEARRFADDWRPHWVQMPSDLVGGDGADGWVCRRSGGPLVRVRADDGEPRLL
jgi:hypothetical protein